jgi:hypothetical protein
VVNLKKYGDLLDDLKETFDNLRKYKMMLNPNKYVFGMSSGKLLDYMVSFRGIDANPTKVEAIEKLQPPRTWKEIHKLAGMMAALSRFISKLGERGMPFYKLLQKANGFGMIKLQQRSINSSNIWSRYEPWFHQGLKISYYYTWRRRMQ